MRKKIQRLVKRQKPAKNIASRKSPAQKSRLQKVMTTHERQAFEQSVLRQLKKIGAENSTVLVAASGGVDSMVLLETIKQWQRTLNLNLAVAYIHHGDGGARPSKNIARLNKAQSRLASAQENYRDAAQIRVEEYCDEHGIRFLTNKRRPKGLKSEDDFRKFRWAQLAAFADQLSAQGEFKRPASALANLQAQNILIATAHHADDLIETQLLRLLRGTGSQGLRGFSGRDPLNAQITTRVGTNKATQKFIIRPLLAHTKDQIRSYAKTKKLTFTQDPSNKTTDALRNWLREKWLKPLGRRDQQKFSNLSKSLAGSLAELGKHQVKLEWPKTLFQKATLHTPTLLTLNKSQREAALAAFMNNQQMKNYTRNHVAEIMKRLDTNAKELKFRLLGREWKITAQHISYGRLDVPSE